MERYYDLSHYGLYLYDFYINCKNFGLPYLAKQKPPEDTFARALFVLDTQNIINQNHHTKFFYPLWHGRNGVVYIASTKVPSKENPQGSTNVIMNTLTLIQILDLGNQITSNIFERNDMNKAFEEALGEDKQRFFQHLFKSQYLGVNAKGDKVLSSHFGRFIFDNKKEFDDLLYSKSPQYELAVLKRYAIDHDFDFSRIAGILSTSQTQIDVTFANDDVIDLFPIMTHQHYINQTNDANKAVVDRQKPVVMACLLNDLLPKVDKLTHQLFYDAFIKCYEFERNRRLSEYAEMGMPIIPMAMCICLLGLLGSTSFAAAQINLPLLAIMQKGEAVLGSSSNQTNFYLTDSKANIKLKNNLYEISNKANIHQLSIFTHSTLVENHRISFNFDGKEIYGFTFRYDPFARLLKFLETRQGNGLSIFLVPCLQKGVIGDGEILKLIQWLVANYLNVDIVDIDKRLFYHNIETSDWRMITIGNTRSPSTQYYAEFQKLSETITPYNRVDTIDSYNEFYNYTIGKMSLIYDQAILDSINNDIRKSTEQITPKQTQLINDATQNQSKSVESSTINKNSGDNNTASNTALKPVAIEKTIDISKTTTNTVPTKKATPAPNTIEKQQSTDIEANSSKKTEPINNSLDATNNTTNESEPTVNDKDAAPVNTNEDSTLNINVQSNNNDSQPTHSVENSNVESLTSTDLVKENIAENTIHSKDITSTESDKNKTAINGFSSEPDTIGFDDIDDNDTNNTETDHAFTESGQDAMANDTSGDNESKADLNLEEWANSDIDLSLIDNYLNVIDEQLDGNQSTSDDSYQYSEKEPERDIEDNQPEAHTPGFSS